MNITFDLIVKIVILLWISAAILYYLPGKKSYVKNIAVTLSFTSVLILGFYIIQLWISLERPPLRTKG